MTPQELKNSILQLVIQGKLVDQRSEEGTAEELYKHIQAEKQRLIKAGTIKNDKPLPEITEDEKPFDIPESWKWVRIGSITTLNPKSYLSSQIILPKTERKSFRWFCFCNDEGLLNGMIPNIYSKVEHYETHSMPMIFGPIVLTQQNSKGDTMGITQSEIDSLKIDVFKSIQTIEN